MQTEKIQINLSPETPKAEVIIREVNEVNELPILAPIKPEISGVLGAPFEFLQKRRTVALQLYSPGANQAIEEIRDAMIEDELARIREICEDIAIIEQ